MAITYFRLNADVRHSGSSRPGPRRVYVTHTVYGWVSPNDLLSVTVSYLITSRGITEVGDPDCYYSPNLLNTIQPNFCSTVVLRGFERLL
jgi:hypothetical protein